MKKAPLLLALVAGTGILFAQTKKKTPSNATVDTLKSTNKHTDNIDDRMKGPNGEKVYIGPGGGRYYLNKSGNKVYVEYKGNKKKKS